MKHNLHNFKTFNWGMNVKTFFFPPFGFIKKSWSKSKTSVATGWSCELRFACFSLRFPLRFLHSINLFTETFRLHLLTTFDSFPNILIFLLDSTPSRLVVSSDVLVSAYT